MNDTPRVRHIRWAATLGNWGWSCVQHPAVRYLVAPACLLYLLGSLLAGALADALLFHPHAERYDAAVPVISIPTTGGDTLAVMFLDNPAATYTILYSSGNAEDLRDITPRLTALRDLGFQVVAYDYRGTGQSTGSPTEGKCYEDIQAVFAYVTTTRQVPTRRVILYGRSLGCGPAIHQAVRQPVAGLVVQSGFTSAFRLVGDYMLLPGDRFDNLHAIAQVRCPVLVIHGRADIVVPFRHGVRLYNAVRAPKSALWVDDAGHNDLQEVAGDAYTTALMNYARGLPH